MHVEQGGFFTGRGTFELFYILRCIIEEQAEKHGKVYLAFLDLQKAFDKVIHNLVLLKYKNELNMDSGLWFMLSKLFDNFNVKVKWGRILTDWIRVNVGVFQGSVLSPMHFKMYINTLIGRLKAVGSGIKVSDVIIVATLVFTDDVLIIDTVKDKFEQKLKIASDWARNTSPAGQFLNV